MNIRKIIGMELRNGIIRRWKFFVFISVISSVYAGVFLFQRESIILTSSISRELSIWDIMIFFFRGMKEYRPEFNQAFEIDDAYLIWNLLLAYFIGDYSVRDFRSCGMNILIRTKNRHKLISSKYIWCIISAILFYVSIISGVILTGAIGEISTRGINAEIIMRIFESNETINIDERIVVKIIFISLFVSIAMSVVQVTVSLIMGSVMGFITTIVICGLSAYYMKWFFIGNAMMIYRYDVINPNGIQGVSTAVLAVIIVIVCWVIGSIYFENKDIIK